MLVHDVFPECLNLCNVLKVVILEMRHCNISIAQRTKHGVVNRVVMFSFDEMPDTKHIAMLTPRHGIKTVGGVVTILRCSTKVPTQFCGCAAFRLTLLMWAN